MYTLYMTFRSLFCQSEMHKVVKCDIYIYIENKPVKEF